MSRDLGRDVPNLEKLYARKLWADFSYPIKNCHFFACFTVCFRMGFLKITSGNKNHFLRLKITSKDS